MTGKIGENCTIEDAIDNLRISLFALEIFANLNISLISVLIVVLLSRTKIFSRNPKIQLFNQQFASFSIAMTRFFLIPHALSQNTFLHPFAKTFTQYFHDCAINVNTFNQIAITVECTLSTFWPGLSEKITMATGICAISLIWPWIVTYVLYILEQLDIVETIPLFEALEVLNLIITYLYFLNRLKYKSVAHGNLSGKYQIIVNIRTVRTLNLVSILSAIRNLITMSLLLFIILYLKPRCDYYAYLLSSHSYDLTVAVYSITLPIPLIMSHDEFKKHFLQLILRRKNRSIEQSLGRNVPKNAFGENLVMQNTGADYFRQLTASWGNSNNSTIVVPLQSSSFCVNGTKNNKMKKEHL